MLFELAAQAQIPTGSRRQRPARSGPRPVPADLPARAGTPEGQDASAIRGKALLESHFDAIQEKLRHLGRRSGLPDHEAEEFRSWALFKLVEDDYRVLARWEGRSSFSTYLTIVLVNLMRDFRIHLWGKWRPSAEARRQGKDAVLLERLWLRDGIPLDEVVHRMRVEHGVSLSRSELERIAAGLPRRFERRKVGEEELKAVPVDGQVESRLQGRERTLIAARLRDQLPPLLQSLPAEDRLLLKLHYREGLSMAAISPFLGRPQRELYSLRDRCLRKLRQALEESGLSAEGVLDLLGSWLEGMPLEGSEIWK